MRGDVGQVLAGVRVGTERVHPPHVAGDARISGSQQCKRPAHRQTNQPDAMRIDLRPGRQEPKGIHDSSCLPGVEVARQERGRVGDQHRHA